MFEGFGETAAAISTPRASGGISVIRISGERAFEICDKLFKPVSTSKKPSEMDGYTCAYGKITDENGEITDDCILTVFRAPRSYTGEDVAEISCHGGIYISEKVLRLVLQAGAVPAGKGEFTKRAFLNGKLTLTQAEAVMDMISAEGKAVHRRAVNVREGALYKKVRDISSKLLTLSGELGAWVDYPEEDIPEVSEDNMTAVLEELRGELSRLKATYDNNAVLKSGIDTVIAGKPNVGKSTLMNLLAGCEKSIVTDIAGTTRDIVEESVRLGDIVLRLSDTAGLRDSNDIVESFGIEKAKKKIQSCDLVIAVFDNGLALDDDDRELIELCSAVDGVKVIACINKSDCENRLDTDYICRAFENVVRLSARDGEGIDSLQNVLNSLFITDSDIYDDLSVNERQKLCIDRAYDNIVTALTDLRGGMTLDAVTIVLDDALNSLNELTGERATESVVNEVFSHFCVGK